MKTRPLLFLALYLPLPAIAAEAEWRTLFNGKDLTGWSKTVDGTKPGEDPDRLIQIREGAIHMYPDTPEGTKVPFGVVTYEQDFSYFELSFDYRWMGKKFPPRAEALRDAGVLYHVKDTSKIWPDGVECQVQEGDSGDLVLIHAGALTWMQPDPSKAPAGQGDPGLLPEEGGVPVSFAPEWPYIGRFPVADKADCWNTVNLVVHGSEYAEHTINGQTLVRLINMVDIHKKPLGSGKISLQLEGAEIAYQNVRIRELAPPVVPSQRILSLSAVAEKAARPQSFTLTNPRQTAIATPFKLTGADASAFEITTSQENLKPGETATWTVSFKPTRGAARYSAGLQIGDASDGAFIILQGIGLAAFEGENEPPLERIVHALGIPLDVGGKKLSLDTKAATIGKSVATGYFVPAGDGKVRVTPLARFSPKGLVPIGIFTRNSETLTRIGQLADSSSALPDAHQTLLPPWENGSQNLEIDPGNEPFGFYMEGHLYTSFTDPAKPSKATIPNTTRVYPIESFQGKPLKNAWIIGFEEASNGDYQDAVLLIENVKPATP